MPGGMGMNMGGGGMGMSSGASAAPTRQPPPIEHTLNLSLEELYRGTSKRMRITKKVCLSEVTPPWLRTFVGAVNHIPYPLRTRVREASNFL